MRFQRLLAIGLCAAAMLLHPVAFAKDGKQHIEFWTMSLKPKFVPYFDNLVKRYEAENPGVEVE